MILHEIVLENVGVFKGLHEIPLSPKGPKKPITLIGALNGSGKTTILKALQLVLFGKKAMHLVPKSMNYYEFIKNRIINEDNNLSDISRIVLTYTTSEFGETKHYRLERTWRLKKDQVQEQFEVYLDHQHSPNLSDNWNNEVQRLLPPSIAKLFFYDGEQIEMLADPDQSAASLKEGIYNLLGIDVIESLQVDLKKIISERQKTVSKEAKKEIELIESSINQIQKKIKAHKDKKAITHEAIDALVKQRLMIILNPLMAALGFDWAR